ncbi:MAG: serine hydrolase domain-containing protein, partial [Thermoanaerobaculia bacterium]|nr:serine hydrolase domain-containing protein [Thermoanaerobaculia bacterium]
MRVAIVIIAIIIPFTSCVTSGNHAMTEKIDHLMSRYEGEVPGASLLVMRAGRSIVSRSWGYADLEERVPATPATNYRLASVTKQFTAASILLLTEDGRLSIDDPIAKWLPSLPPATEEVTIRHLLTHTSGLIDYEDLIPESATEQVHDEDVLDLLEREDRLYFEPGSSYRYSNSGYSLLALIVERASGLSFAEFLRERIFQPLEMSRSVALEEGISTVPNRAYGYSRSEDGWTRDDQSITSAVLGDGGIYSSIDDLSKWDAALYDDRLLSDESRRLAFTPAVVTDRPGVAYGFGWRIEEDGLMWHTGETRGFRNVILRDSANRLTIVILTNRNEGNPHEIARKLWSAARSAALSSVRVRTNRCCSTALQSPEMSKLSARE